MMFVDVDWPLANTVTAFTTTRQGGYSISPYHEFNLGTHVGDDYTRVLKNRSILVNKVSQKPIAWLNQVHGNDVAVIDSQLLTSLDAINDQSMSHITADAAFTREKHVALAILTADCLPILIADRQGLQLAAIHGGWRPLASGIIKNTLAHFSAPREQLFAWLGPCIGEHAFEVGGDVLQAFTALSPELEVCFKAKRNDKYLANLHEIARYLLKQQGIEQIFTQPDCTYRNPEHYFSYRRDTITGRMATVITARC
ncbi:peptidoglycan editing factor PgeF [Thalassotalea maritima]|uniref:peptidoglycan editing factor PgeF n=1 Tax=Thalassotalea maritima TaxID=3242416 RepID=UPI003528700B